jgi:hypothetical protein
MAVLVTKYRTILKAEKAIGNLRPFSGIKFSFWIAVYRFRMAYKLQAF